MLSVFRNTKIHFLKLWKYCIIISSVLIIGTVTVAGIRMAKADSILSVDFTGGSQLVFNYKNYVPQGKVEDALKKAGYQSKLSYKSSPVEGNRLEVVISGQKVSEAGNSKLDEITTILNKDFPNAHFKGMGETIIGGLVGASFAWAAVLAMLISFVGMIIYVSLRFELTYACAAIIALLHDVIIGTGVLIACDRQISLTVIAAILTVVGYSVNDTIIVFDRIRENLSLRKDLNYREIIDLSINQTLSRTVITSFLTFLVVLILFLYGGVAINNFALIMLAGIIVGTYSSIFVASPLVAYWHKKVIGIKD